MRPSPKLIPVVLLALLLTACPKANPTVPVAPTPPQVTVANAVNLLAQSLSVASTSIIVARDQGALTPQHTRAAQGVIVSLARIGKQVNAVLLSPDAWETKRAAILALVVTSGVQEAAKALPPAAGAILSSSTALLQQILAAVGGAS
jgi:hypothetical protein